MAEMKLHAIMISFPFQGHITPFINLALKLASHGWSITFVHTESIHEMLSKARDEDETDLFSAARESGLDIRYKTIYDGFPPEYDRLLNFKEYWETILRDFPSRVCESVGNIIQQCDDDEDDASNLVHVLIADTFYSWPATIAKEYKFLNVSFWTEPALVFCTSYHHDLLTQNGYFPTKGNQGEDVIDFIPGISPIKFKDLSSHFQDTDITSVTHQIVIKAFEQVKHADFILMNTVYELEHETLSYLNKIHPTYAIGPINFSAQHFTKTVVPKSLWSQKDCTEWLSHKPRGSVLYVSFASLAEGDKQLCEEIAHGLLLSEVNFIWVIKEDTGVLPDGFKNEMMGDKGLIVSWCNQNAVLSDPAVGGFLTHCGWNSTLESMWCGVPMICYPFYADQPTNRKLVVDDWKIGINLRDGSSVDRNEVAEKIKKVMRPQLADWTDYSELRREIKKFRTIMHSALNEDGSSNRSFDQFLKDLRAKANTISCRK